MKQSRLACVDQSQNMYYYLSLSLDKQSQAERLESVAKAILSYRAVVSMRVLHLLHLHKCVSCSIRHVFPDRL